MVEMGRRFFDASGYSDIASFDLESLRLTFEGLVTSDGSVCLVVENGHLVGIAVAIIYPFYFNRHHITAQEMLWWVDKEHRGIGSKLLDALLLGCKSKGAESVSMIALEKLDPERVGSIYEKRGLRPSERSFIGRL